MADDEERPEADIEERAESFMKSVNIKEMDSKHLAYAEAAKADIFLTVDYRLIKSAQKLSLSFQVMNPVDYPEWRRKQQSC